MREKHTAQPITPRLTPAKRAAAHLGIPYTSLRALAFQGELPVVKLGRSWYFETSALDQWVERSKERIA
jgi:excisionase family DNA binding protein